MTNRIIWLRACVATLGLCSAPSHAQVRLYGVAEAGAERRKVLTDAERVAPIQGVSAPRDHKDGFAYGIAIGAEVPVSPVLFVGAEASVFLSEVDTEADQFRGILLDESVLIGVNERTTIDPRWGYAVTARAGVNLTRSVAVYGLAGLGGERVRRDFESGSGGIGFAATVRTKQRFDNFTYGAGARLFLTDHVGIRVEYRRIDADDGYKPQRLMAGAILRL